MTNEPEWQSGGPAPSDTNRCGGPYRSGPPATESAGPDAVGLVGGFLLGFVAFSAAVGLARLLA
ncbi:hypothetical protein [Halorarum salinum]|uniref:Uncharacterized protein n=1 Tax=Halorarum salinum TaxID=2743089 RepID=A0A7D5LDJ4_9EURY|nr:hypothetical protein [Halobaculum salinum]QLG64232.1 hypothetical protein HUG12_20830 [Halobaculum salinum]